MKKEELAMSGSDGGPADNGPIEEHLRALASDKDLPDFAIDMCVARIEESGPVLRTILAKAAEGEALTEGEEMLVFRGVYILGEARDTEAWPILLRLLRRPADELDHLLGAAITQSLAQIATGMYDGDADSLFAVIAERSVESFVRSALFGAATFLTWEGRIGRDRMRSFLQRFYDERLAEDNEYAWVGWLEAIALLGLRDLAPLFHRAWEEGRIDTSVLGREHFEKDLAEAEKDPSDSERFEGFGLGYLDNAVEALAWTRTIDRLAELPSRPHLRDTDWVSSAPFINPMRDVGRNDPCPCGSGKKAKKCCLANQPWGT
ncbi:DUF1186 domain-containing protein [Taklimakanibacter deserti]|uniref:DUF1186 domain-containing protein n=1 Tax=Taklimakanibacter deserti TaxID=2267839 RepID=UPI000E64DA0D